MQRRCSSFARVLQRTVGGLFHDNIQWSNSLEAYGSAYKKWNFSTFLSCNSEYNFTQKDDTLGPVSSNAIRWNPLTCRKLRGTVVGKQDQWPLFPFRSEHTLSREWLVQRMKMDRKRKEMKQKRSLARRIKPSVVADQDSMRFTFDYYQGSGFQEAHQPPASQPLIGPLRPTCLEEVKLAPMLARPILMITRNVEWANIAFGFEQQNRYVIMDPLLPEAPVGYILEESNWFMRQILRTRRPFVAYLLDGVGAEAFRVRRPAWLINSTTYIEVDGKVIGEVHRRWHLWKRVYDLYLGKKQFAYVENRGFWFWTFSVRDENADILAEIDRNWRGFGYELFTDAGQYVVRFGELPADVSGRPTYSENEFSIPSWQDQSSVPQVDSLSVSRPLTLMERAIVLALAVSLDNDYFSRHVMGLGIPFPMVGEAQ